MSLRLFLSLISFASPAVVASADPLSKKIDIDFFRDVPSRNLKGLSTRSDGRLVAGPTFSELAVRAPADLLWCLVPKDAERVKRRREGHVLTCDSGVAGARCNRRTS